MNTASISFATALGVSLLCAPLTPVVAQQKAATPEPATAHAGAAKASEPAWRVQCNGTGAAVSCQMSQAVFVRPSGRRLLSLTVRRPSKTEPPALMLQLPLGLFLPAGATLQVDKAKAEALAIQTCDGSGCYAGAPMTPELLATLQKSTTLTVTMQDLQKKPIVVSLPLGGFGTAYQKVQ